MAQLFTNVMCIASLPAWWHPFVRNMVELICSTG